MASRARVVVAALPVAAAFLIAGSGYAQDTISLNPPADACHDPLGCTNPISGLKWRPASGGEIPDDAWVAGFENAPDGRRDLYVCRAFMRSADSPQVKARWGKIGRGYGGCSVVGFGVEMVVRQYGYEVLVTPFPGSGGDMMPVTWVKTTRNLVPVDAFFMSGYAMCRATYKGGLHPGGAKSSAPGCVIASGGRLFVINEHEVLTRVPIRVANAPPPRPVESTPTPGAPQPAAPTPNAPPPSNKPQAAAPPPPPSPVELPVGYAVTVPIPGQSIEAKFTLVTRTAVTIDAARLPGGVNPYISMRQPDGQTYSGRRLGSDESATITTNELEPGTYGLTVIAEGSAENRNLRLVVAPLARGSIVGNLVAGPGYSRDGYVSFPAQQSQRISVDVRAPAAVATGLTSITLIGEGGHELKTVRATEVLTWDAGKNLEGVYLVRVSRSDNGSDGQFVVTAAVQTAAELARLDSARSTPAPPPPSTGPATGEVAIGEKLTLQFDPSTARHRGAEPTQYYGVTCERGAQLQIDVVSTWNNYALLLDKHQDLVTAADDIAGTNARLFHECADSARYLVAVQSKSPTPGPFTLQVRRLDGSSGNSGAVIAVGQSRTANMAFGAGQYSDLPFVFYGFACDNMDNVSFRTSGGFRQPQLILFDPAGTAVRSGVGSMDVGCGRRGMWVIAVGGNGVLGIITVSMVTPGQPTRVASEPSPVDPAPPKPAPPTRRPVDYAVRITTGTASGAGTDANVFLTIQGSLGATGAIRLNPLLSGDAFEAGHVDQVTLRGIPDLGPIQGISVWHDNTYAGASWQLSNITVTAVGAGASAAFPCSCWLDGSRNRQTLFPR